MKLLSLFDGMACGMIAMRIAGVEVESYDAYEIDKYAIETAQHNFPMIKEHGDVFGADFTQYEGVDFLIGGSPCTYWSIAQTKNRETVASGMGWELFSQYVRALHEAKPKYFIYENNKSMSKDIRASIDEAFGFEAVLINSALVSAQNRQRLYWVGRRNEDGTYSKVNLEQPADRGILLKDVLDNAVAMREKAHAVIASAGRTTEREFFVKNQGNMATEPINVTASGKAKTISASYAYKGDGEGSLKSELFPDKPIKQTSNYVAEPINTDANGESFCVTSRYYKGFGNNPGKCLEKHRDSMVAEAINVTEDGKSQTLKAQYCKNSVANFCCYSSTYGASGVAEPVRCMQYELKEAYVRDSGCVARLDMPNCHDILTRVYGWNGKCPTLTAHGGGNTEPKVFDFYSVCFNCSIEFDDDGKPIKAIGKDGKEITIYEVRDGKITIKGKQYPIKLRDGYYIIRKLTVSECKRLQTVPEWYEFPVSDSQAYKMLGNGWTCEVIAHILKYLKEA